MDSIQSDSGCFKRPGINWEQSDEETGALQLPETRRRGSRPPALASASPAFGRTWRLKPHRLFLSPGNRRPDGMGPRVDQRTACRKCESVRRAIRAVDRRRVSRSRDSAGERHFRRTITELVEHYHLERNHQGLDNRVITGTPTAHAAGRVRRRSRLGGLMNYYERAA